MDFSQINLTYAVESNRTGQRYPALQATDYKPKTLKDNIQFCLSESSYDLLDPDGNLFETEVVECGYNRETVLMHQIVSPVRWVFLTLPQLFVQDRKTKEISDPEKGQKLAGTNKVTLAKCFLACLVGDSLLKDITGLPQIFTLKLTSSKTQLIGYLPLQADTKTLVSLNTALQKHCSSKDNLLHLVSVQLGVNPQEFVSSSTNESSLGVMFQILGDAQVLKPSHQKQIFELITDQNIQALFDNPFNLKTTPQLNEPNGVVDSGELSLEIPPF